MQNYAFGAHLSLPHMHSTFKCMVCDWRFCPYAFGEYSLTISIWVSCVHKVNMHLGIWIAQMHLEALCQQWHPYAFGRYGIDSMHLGIVLLTKCTWVSCRQGYPYAFGKYLIDSMHLVSINFMSITTCIWWFSTKQYAFGTNKENNMCAGSTH